MRRLSLDLWNSVDGMGRFLFIFSLIILSATMILGGSYLWLKSSYARSGPLLVPVTVIIPKGLSPEGIAELLRHKGVVDDQNLFKWGWRILSSSKPLRAGEFAFKPGMSVADVVDHLQTGKAVLHKVTIAEGLNNSQIIKILANTPGLTGPPGQLPEEGRLLPETYYFSYGDSRSSIIKRMRDSMTRVLSDEWSRRIPDLPLLDPREALILASIVEKETGINSERSRVAGVFLNRLRLGMRLQSDPTVIFGITEGRKLLGRAITKSDLRSETLYNTYLVSGLPPGPISNPGRASIIAVLNPASSRDLYFVADGTGGHAFAESLKGHLRNVKKWRRIERERRNRIN